MSRWISVALMVGVVGCERPPASPASSTSPPVDPASLARAQEAASALGGSLQVMLLTALERGGPEAALAFCADSAQAVSARYSTGGLTVRRTSLRVRNPANLPDADERRVLGHLASLHAEGRLPPEYSEVLSTSGGGRTLFFAKPIVIQERCLACHGDRTTIRPSLAQLLTQRYPADSATGYRAGDLRGIVAVRVVLPGAPSGP